MEIKIREIAADEYCEVVVLWNDVLGVRTVTHENFRITMEQMNKAGTYKTFVALFENQVVGFVSIVHGLAVGSANGYLHITGLAVHKDFQRFIFVNKVHVQLSFHTYDQFFLGFSVSEQATTASAPISTIVSRLFNLRQYSSV